MKALPLEVPKRFVPFLCHWNQSGGAPAKVALRTRLLPTLTTGLVGEIWALAGGEG